MEERPGFWVRAVANLLDAIIVGTIFGLMTLAVYGEFHRDEYNFTDVLSLLYVLLVPVFWNGYLIGKKLLGIRIVKTSGDNVTIWTMLLRGGVGGLVYGVTIGIGLIVSAFMVGIRYDRRSIHDFIAGTYVAYDSERSVEVAEKYIN